MQLRCLYYTSFPLNNRLFTCTRSVRLVTGYVTKWQTCLPIITTLFDSLANGVRLGCQAGPRSKLFFNLICTKILRICTYKLRLCTRGRLFFHFFCRFFTIFYVFWSILYYSSVFYLFLSAATVGSGFFVAFCIVFVLKYQGGEGFRHRTSTFMTRLAPIYLLLR